MKMVLKINMSVNNQMQNFKEDKEVKILSCGCQTHDFNSPHPGIPAAIPCLFNSRRVIHIKGQTKDLDKKEIETSLQWLEWHASSSLINNILLLGQKLPPKNVLLTIL